jgi:DNA-binding GntR family transcriptional regulator
MAYKLARKLSEPRGGHRERLCEAIEEDIVYGRLGPGARLDELALAERFSVSRTPIREALLQLSSSGLVLLRPRRGAIVAEVGPQGLYEMFETMAELEAACARFAARRMTIVERQGFRRAHEDCQKPAAKRASDVYFELNERFHLLLYEGSHNGFLAEQARALQRRLRPYRRLQLRVPARIEQSFAEHGKIVEAVCDGHAERSAESIRDHVSVQGERFGDLVAAVGSMKAASLKKG